MTQAANNRKTYRPPEHENAEPHRRLMQRLREMTSDQIFDTIVEAGIYTEDGHLTRDYGGEAEPSGNSRSG